MRPRAGFPASFSSTGLSNPTAASPFAGGLNLPPAPAVPNEFEMSARDFDRVCQLIRKRAGIALNSSKRTMVYSRLARRLRATGKGSFEEYLDWLEKAGGAEWQDFINALTTNLTSFFREAHHFPVLQEHLRKLRGRDRINIWCCAASTGEEPYTIAISAMEAFNSMDPPVRIIATDIDTNVLETARAGAYRDESVTRLPPDIVRKYFQRPAAASSDGYMKVRPELMNMVSFRPLNLLDAQWPLRPGLDAIFCRNVMIYFDKDTQFSILRRFAPLLNPGGLLFVGHSENFSQARDTFQLLGKTVYQVNPAVAARPGNGRGNA
jgi:chemotaxis protein methyltransferase CheR